jgi:hypothetical protein
MSTYTYPEMPLFADVWHRAASGDTTEPPDREDVPCSCSPLKPQEFMTGWLTTGHYHALTHIIRTAVDPAMIDNYLRGDEPGPFPATLLEIPAGSGHRYYCVHYHVVGAGFSNEHARIYAARWNLGLLEEQPWFVGWI